MKRTERVTFDDEPTKNVLVTQWNLLARRLGIFTISHYFSFRYKWDSWTRSKGEKDKKEDNIVQVFSFTLIILRQK